MQGRGTLLALDTDPLSLKKAENRLQPFGNLITRQINYRGLQGVLRELGWQGVDGMVFDLGFSSVQLDDPERGFSFQKEGPLDMRLDPTKGETALTHLRRMSSKELIQLLKEFGQEQRVEPLSREILSEVSAGRLQTTTELAALCDKILGRSRKVHPATNVFLALRCRVNDELGGLRDLLDQAPLLLNPNGRLAIITFHSLEDGLVKERFRALDGQEVEGKKFLQVSKKPLLPTETEIESNPRSRSAKLRVLERVL